MSARAVEPSAIQEFIFGDQRLHARFSMAIGLLARIVVANPRPVTTAALSEALGQSPRATRALLSSLHQSGLLCRDAATPDAWFRSPELGSITLADIFRSVAAATPEVHRKKCEAPCDDDVRTGQQGVDLLLMQATMTINQVVLQHLQAFDLGRLKAVGAPPACLHRLNTPVRSYIAEPL